MWKLLTRFGEAGEADFPLLDELTIGRAPENTIWLDDPLLSRRHARVFLEGEAAFVEDLESTNGVYRNGERLNKPTELRPGDVLMIGGYKMLVTWSGQGPAPVAPSEPLTNQTFHLTTHGFHSADKDSSSPLDEPKSSAAKPRKAKSRPGCLVVLLLPTAMLAAAWIW